MKRIRNLFRRRSLERDLSVEMASHLEEKVDELMARGMSREEALFTAKRSFGNATLLAEQGREVWKLPLAEVLARDLRIGIRSLGRTPLFTGMAAGILALGIGANCAMFSVIDAVLLRPLPFRDSQRIVVLWERPP